MADTATKLVITEYTDPICIWCYAMDPALRRLKLELSERMEFHSVLGLLVPDATRLIGKGPLANVVFGRLRAHVRSEFSKAAARTGIPYSDAFVSRLTPEDATSVPSSTAVCAMRLVDADASERYLRRIREAYLSDDLNASDERILLDLAREQDVDLDAFERHLRDGSAADELRRDVRRKRDAGAKGFPTFELSYGDRREQVAGYVEYAELVRAVERVAGGELTPEPHAYTPDAAAEFVSTYGRVAAVELKLAFSLDDAGLSRATEELVASGAFEREDRGSSYFIRELPLEGGLCDPVTGICSL